MSAGIKLKTTQVAATRAAMLVAQGGRCQLCNLPCSPTQGVLDHDHSTGAVRAVLHRGCNSLLGKVENNHKRYGVPSVAAFGSGLGQYLQRHLTNITGLIHPTHKSEDEKRIARNTKARKTRAAAKGST